MIRLMPATRAFLLACAVVAAGADVALAATAAEKQAADDASIEAGGRRAYTPTIYGGASVGYSDKDDGDFAWQAWVLARFFNYGAIQLEYFDLGSFPGPGSGDYDGLYVGLMPILPLPMGFNLFGQVGAAFSEAGDDVAGGAGVMYEIPVELLNKNHTELALRLDYKYLNLSDGENLVTFGIMLGFRK